MTFVQPLEYAVPAYFHPAVARREWSVLADSASSLRFVVLNVHNGVGDETEALYREVADELNGAGVQLVGYIDSRYGTRPVKEMVAEAAAYRDRYGVTGVFLDQAASTLDELSHYETCIVGLRAGGARFVVINPGSHPHPGYADLANVTVTYEGSWALYANMVEPAWVLSRPASRFCHLIYETPHEVAADPMLAMTGRHARTVCLTEGTPPNVWSQLPTVLARS
jgi:hypothetical protein